MKSVKAFMIYSIVIISAVVVTHCGGGANFKKDTPSYSTTLGQELIDLEAAYKKGIITQEEYNRQKNVLIEQRIGKGK
jgi:hypothetical protein